MAEEYEFYPLADRLTSLGFELNQGKVGLSGVHHLFDFYNKGSDIAIDFYNVMGVEEVIGTYAKALDSKPKKVYIMTRGVYTDKLEDVSSSLKQYEIVLLGVTEADVKIFEKSIEKSQNNQT